MNEYQCWFCGEGIERSDTGAVLITLESLWRWDSRISRRKRPAQSVYGHSACARGRMKGATMEIEPSIFGEDG